MTDLRTILPTAAKVAGLRQVRRELDSCGIATAVLAADADPVLKEEVLELSRSHGVEVLSFPSKSELGKLCGLDVPCAVVGLTVPTKDRPGAEDARGCLPRSKA